MRATDEVAVTDDERETLRIQATLRTYAAFENDRDRARRVLKGETVRQALVNALMSVRFVDAKP